MKRVIKFLATVMTTVIFWTISPVNDVFASEEEVTYYKGTEYKSFTGQVPRAFNIYTGKTKTEIFDGE